MVCPDGMIYLARLPSLAPSTDQSSTISKSSFWLLQQSIMANLSHAIQLRLEQDIPPDSSRSLILAVWQETDRMRDYFRSRFGQSLKIQYVSKRWNVSIIGLLVMLDISDLSMPDLYRLAWKAGLKSPDPLKRVFRSYLHCNTRWSSTSHLVSHTTLQKDYSRNF